VYSTCLFCNKPLGANEAIEAFPVGRRLAFDPAKGRLWVVCKQCERWNLSPLEERWEAIEEAERIYRDTRRRVSTDNIGLAKLRDGTELVRIGEPLRPEFAAWRYGDQFGRRRRRQMILAGAGLGALGAIVIGGVTVGVGVGSFAWILGRAGNSIVRGSAESVVARIRTPTGETLRVRRRHLLETTISQGIDAPFAVNLRYVNGESHFEGADAMRIASIVVPAANRFGGSKETVAKAVGAIEESGGAEGFLDRLSRVASVTTRRGVPRRGRGYGWGGRWENRDWSTGLFGIDSVQRLALEMALHEDAERSALEGELGQLERAWREAEEIAGIADDLLLPDSLTSTLDKLRRKS
jgi:hypothetical protein